MRDLNLHTWPRRAHYEAFRTYDQPHFSVTADVDVSALVPLLKARGLPFMLSVTHLLTRAAHEVTPFRWRMRGDRVVEHDHMDPSVTVALPDGDLFGFCLLPYTADPLTFLQRAELEVALAQAHPSLDDTPGRDDVLYLSSLPWLTFTSVTHAMHLSPADSIPRLTTGRYTRRDGAVLLPLNVQVHHALMDGRHLGQYFTVVQDLLNAPEVWLAGPAPTPDAHSPARMDADLLAGARHFNAGQWWEAHEAWEEPWHTATGERRAFLSALILLAAALHKRWHMHSTGERNYLKALRYVNELPPVVQGVELRALAAAVQDALKAPGETHPQLPL